MNLLAGIEQDFHRSLPNPGAYEWWHFDGIDAKSDFAFSLQFFAGNLFSAYYQDNLKTYWEKTKSPLLAPSGHGPVEGPDSRQPAVPPAPPDAPNPLDYCGVAFRLFHKGRTVGEGLQEFPAKYFKASDKEAAVLLGPNRFNWNPQGDPPSYGVTAQAPLRGGKGLLRARLFFTPILKEFPTFSRPETPSTHTWILAAPLCHVEGTFQWCDSEGEVERAQAFVGRGYHDHHFGSVPLSRFVKAWHWGRAFLGDETLVYSVRIPTEGGEPPEGFLLTAGKDGAEAWETAFKLSQNRRNFFWLPYQKTLEFTDVHSLHIRHRQILSDGPASLIFQDDVRWTADGKSLKGLGLSNYVYTPRLSSRLFFPMLKGKTTVFNSPDFTGELPAGPGDVSTTRPGM